MLFVLLIAIVSADIWPYPKEIIKGNTKVEVSTAFKFGAEGVKPDSEFVSEAFQRCGTVMFPHNSPATPGKNSDALGSISITVASSDESHPQLETDESYHLNVPTKGPVVLKCNTVYGMLRGLESFSQLVRFDFESEKYFVDNAPITINDAPRFPHRGLMIDTSRHFETLAVIRDTIDSLPYAKINVLHWHMSDSPSFPMQSKTYPKLWDGAYSEQERYTQADVAEIIEYARKRGVRVMVEFDVPGHASSWCHGYPEICPSKTCLEPLNVANNKTFEVIESLLGEMTGKKSSEPHQPSGLFPDDFLHLGGDEVKTQCWSETPEIAQWLSQKGMTPDQGYAYFVNRAAQIAIDQGRRPVQWSEVFDHFKTKLNKKTVVHIWKTNTNVTEVLADGYNVLLNVGNNPKSWYLDNLNVPWDAVYSNEPCTGVPDDLCPMILGGNGEMWGETVDPSDLEQTVWPRFAAIAERLWSPREFNDTKRALPRIEAFRCLLNRRGVRAAPVNNPNARSSPTGPGSCFQQ